MATYSLPAAGQEHRTLDGVNPDQANVPASRQPVDVVVINTGGTTMYARADATAAAAATGTTIVPPGTWATVTVQPGGYASVIGNGNTYSIGIDR